MKYADTVIKIVLPLVGVGLLTSIPARAVAVVSSGSAAAVVVVRAGRVGTAGRVATVVALCVVVTI